jgi:hypothetical protein
MYLFIAMPIGVYRTQQSQLTTSSKLPFSDACRVMSVDSLSTHPSLDLGWAGKLYRFWIRGSDAMHSAGPALSLPAKPYAARPRSVHASIALPTNSLPLSAVID